MKFFGEAGIPRTNEYILVTIRVTIQIQESEFLPLRYKGNAEL